MVDYSKWDNLPSSPSDDGEEERKGEGAFEAAADPSVAAAERKRVVSPPSSSSPAPAFSGPPLSSSQAAATDSSHENDSATLIGYTITRVSDGSVVDQTEVDDDAAAVVQGEVDCTFQVPSVLVPSLITTPLHARGGMFELTRGASPGTVVCRFSSPFPHVTAEALTDRIRQRFLDPSPPGAEECSVS